ncbi:hypothetical protein J6590_012281 [Homalodisca vitripennis]|nr:hypothetical protein J6590_012281 [Homalodisca vitripennis]
MCRFSRPSGSVYDVASPPPFHPSNPPLGSLDAFSLTSRCFAKFIRLVKFFDELYDRARPPHGQCSTVWRRPMARRPPAYSRGDSMAAASVVSVVGDPRRQTDRQALIATKIDACC